MSVATVAVPCPACGSWQGHPVLKGFDRLLGHPGEFTICSCGRCGQVYLNPRPRNLMRYYEGGYLPHIQSTPGRLARLRRLLPRRPTLRARKLSRMIGKPGRLLDIGCASGDFLGEMAEAGWQVAGVEPGDTAAAAAEARFPGKITHGTLEDAGYDDGAFDLVTMWDVIEHLPDPLATLAEIKRILRPGGTLFIQTPRWGCIESRFFGSAWVGLECPRHLSIFSWTTLSRALQTTGFQPTELEQLVSSHWVWALSGSFVVQELLGKKIGQRSYHWFTRRPVRLIAAPFFWTIDRHGIGSLLTVIAKKPSD